MAPLSPRGEDRDRYRKNERSSTRDREHIRDRDRDKYRDRERRRERHSPRHHSGEKRDKDRDSYRSGSAGHQPREHGRRRSRSREHKRDVAEPPPHSRRDSKHDRDREDLPPPPSKPLDADRQLPGPPPRDESVRRGPPREEQGQKEEGEADQPPPKPAEQPNFGLSGKLAAETNTFKGVALLHHEPPEARKPTVKWRLYVFKNGEAQDSALYIHKQSAYMIGRDRKVADIPSDHPSCSKQHAVLQYRHTEKEGPDGMMHKATRPYLLDLGSTNGTFINGERIDPQRYYELLETDMIKFGTSTREYVLLNEHSAA
mmetsp:Transcript_34667/g.65259  ORF Transcript_34667/g.65259 Transcript_34667/m.65259 type:complete len:315 (+) Transcript_34667:31-975(+)